MQTVGNLPAAASAMAVSNEELAANSTLGYREPKWMDSLLVTVRYLSGVVVSCVARTTLHPQQRAPFKPADIQARFSRALELNSSLSHKSRAQFSTCNATYTHFVAWHFIYLFCTWECTLTETLTFFSAHLAESSPVHGVFTLAVLIATNIRQSHFLLRSEIHFSAMSISSGLCSEHNSFRCVS